tara:strand:+ start:77 stop:364 length:288 start_codon:yes stop_codon:yes gene_type:complete
MNTCATDDDKIKKSPIDAIYKPETGDIVIINENGYLKKRHIFNTREQMYTDYSGNNLIKKTVYDVDYGLGLTKEGSIERSQIIRKATEADELIPL